MGVKGAVTTGGGSACAGAVGMGREGHGDPPVKDSQSRLSSTLSGSDPFCSGSDPFCFFFSCTFAPLHCTMRSPHVNCA